MGRLGRRHAFPSGRSEEHTSELQSRSDLVCRLLLEKKKNNKNATKLTEEENIERLEQGDSLEFRSETKMNLRVTDTPQRQSYSECTIVATSNLDTYA